LYLVLVIEVVAGLGSRLLSDFEILHVLLDESTELIDALDEQVELLLLICLLRVLRKSEARQVGMTPADHEFALQVCHQLQEAVLRAEFLLIDALQLTNELLVRLNDASHLLQVLIFEDLVHALDLRVLALRITHVDRIQLDHVIQQVELPVERVEGVQLKPLELWVCLQALVNISQVVLLDQLEFDQALD
jgi:hypothetical protein